MTDPTGAQGGPDDASAQSGTSTDANAADQQDNDAGTGDATKDVQSDATVSQAEYNRLKARLQAADQNREKAQQELRQLKDKDLPELDKLKRELEEKTAAVEALTTKVREQAIDSAFFNANKHTWHDPRAARKLLDMSGVDVAEDGTVSGMEAAVAALAKANPWMLKTDTAGAGAGSASGAGAPPMNGRTGTTNNGENTKALEQRFPALRSRPK